MTFTVNVFFTCITYCDAGPGYDQNCLQVQQINSFHGYHICLPTCYFGDVVGLLLESYTLVQRNSYVSCSYLIELTLELDGQGSFSFDSSRTTGFEFNS